MKQIWISHWDSFLAIKMLPFKWGQSLGISFVLSFSIVYCWQVTNFRCVQTSDFVTVGHLPSPHLRNFAIRFPNKGFFFVYYFKILYFLSKPKILPWVTFIALLGHRTLQTTSWTHLELESMLYILYGLTQIWKKGVHLFRKLFFPQDF